MTESDLINPTAVIFPQINLDASKYQFPVFISPKLNYYKRWATTSFSDSSLTWSMPPANSTTVIDRRMFVYVPIRVTFTGNPGANNYILNPNADAPRQFPFSSCVSTTKLAINGMSYTTNVAELIHPLLKYNVSEELEQGLLSGGFSYPDQASEYSSLFGTNRSPFALYGDTTNQNAQTRGGSSNWTIVSNPRAVGAEQIVAVVDMYTIEPLFLMYPMLAGQKQDKGLYNVSQMDLTFNMLTEQKRIWSRIAQPGDGTLNITYKIGGTGSGIDPQPYILANYYTLLFLLIDNVMPLY